MNGINENKKVEVYFNLHKKCWSIRQAGVPVVHSDFVEIKEPQFVVQQGGNARVRREKRKNVHAYIQGMKMRESLIDDYGTGIELCEWQKITYNPYKHKSFVLVKNESVAVREAWFIEIRKDGVWAYLPEPSTTGELYKN